MERRGTLFTPHAAHAFRLCLPRSSWRQDWLQTQTMSLDKRRGFVAALLVLFNKCVPRRGTSIGGRAPLFASPAIYCVPHLRLCVPRLCALFRLACVASSASPVSPLPPHPCRLFRLACAPFPLFPPRLRASPTSPDPPTAPPSPPRIRALMEYDDSEFRQATFLLEMDNIYAYVTVEVGDAIMRGEAHRGGHRDPTWGGEPFEWFHPTKPRTDHDYTLGGVKGVSIAFLQTPLQ